MDKKPVIAIFSTAYLPFIGGAEIAVKEITARLVGFDFVLITARLKRGLPKREKLGRVDIHRLGWGMPFLDKIWLAFRGASYARKIGNFDFIWAIMASYGGLAALGYKKKNPDAFFLLTLQEGDDLSHIAHRARWLGRRFRKIFKRADKIQAISRYLARWAESIGARAPIIVIPNGVDLEKFKFQSASWRTNFRKEKIRLITASRLVKKNAVDDIVRALAFLPENMSLVIAGDGPERKDLEKLARELNLGGRIEFLGEVRQDEIPSVLSRADIFVRPSLSEGLGNSFLEAMAAGLPVIGTKVGGIPDFLSDGKTGWFAKARNPQSIAACVRYIINPAHQKHVASVIASARALIECEYTWESVTERMRGIFQQERV